MSTRRFDAATGRQINSTTLTLGGVSYAPTYARPVRLGGVWAPVSYSPTRMLHINGTVSAFRYDAQGNTTGNPEDDLQQLQRAVRPDLRHQRPERPPCHRRLLRRLLLGIAVTVD